jgi:hypothetical protein
MTSKARITTLSRSLTLLFAAFVFQTTGVLAGDLVDDAQTQASDLLSGTVHGKAKTFVRSGPTPAGSARTPTLDPQAQARRLILGGADGNATPERKVEPLITATSTLSSRGNRTYVDPQVLARRMILGARNDVL